MSTPSSSWLKKLQFYLTSNQLILLFIIYCLVVLNVGYWINFDQIMTTSPSGRDWLVTLTMPLFLAATMNIIFQLFFYPYVHRVLFPIVLILASAAGYAVMTQGIYFNDDQIVNILQTNPGEAGSWINVKFIAWVIITGIIPALFYAFFIKLKPAKTWYKGIAWRVVSVLASLAIIAAIAAIGYQNYASFFRNEKAIVHKIMPTSYLGALAKVGYNRYESSRPFEPIGLDARRTTTQGSDKNVFILVVGETTRAQNWGLNPGAPDTTPQLAAMSDVINFPDVSSCGTSTAISVPCMFSNMSHADYNPATARHQEGLLDIIQRAGYYVSWRDNDGGCKDVCNHVKHINIIDTADPAECKDGLCHDRTLLVNLKEEIASMPNDGLLVLHTVGSHGPAYYEHDPAELIKFTPTCDTNQLQDCDKQHLENSYNNSIVAIDDMLAKTINLLKDSGVNAALWYMSDHGESLGENGMYLHGAPYMVAPKEQTHIPMIFWANDGFYNAKGLDKACLSTNASQPHSHDNLFSSMLGILDIATEEYKADDDMFAKCRKS